MHLKTALRNKQVTLKQTKVKRNIGIYKQISNNKGTGKICIVRSLGGIGDVLMATPSLLQLRKDFPKLQIYFAIDMSSTDSYKEITKNLDFIDYIISAQDVGNYHFDWTVDITSVCIRHEHHSPTKKNRIDIFAEAIGISQLVNKIPIYRIEKEEINNIQRVLKEGVNIFLHTASFDRQRTPDIKLFHDIVKAMPECNFYVSDFNNINNKNDWKYKNCVNISNMKLRDKAALISQCNLFIGPDSGLMHIAGAVGTKSIVIFGSIPSQVRINYYPTHTAFVKEDLKCLGCWYKPCDIDYKCMKELNIDKLVIHIKERLK